mmetsp:Transcript_96954/g.279018  ORF Transcript_96954/g.279018 Transcript_96954/m.279018 type:complete len:303 (+) Transcript_96954:2229-3137(+)
MTQARKTTTPTHSMTAAMAWLASEASTRIQATKNNDAVQRLRKAGPDLAESVAAARHWTSLASPPEDVLTASQTPKKENMISSTRPIARQGMATLAMLRAASGPAIMMCARSPATKLTPKASMPRGGPPSAPRPVLSNMETTPTHKVAATMLRQLLSKKRRAWMTPSPSASNQKRKGGRSWSSISAWMLSNNGTTSSARKSIQSCLTMSSLRLCWSAVHSELPHMIVKVKLLRKLLGTKSIGGGSAEAFQTSALGRKIFSKPFLRIKSHVATKGMVSSPSPAKLRPSGARAVASAPMTVGIL